MIRAAGVARGRGVSHVPPRPSPIQARRINFAHPQVQVRIDVCPPRLVRNAATASFTLPADPLLRPLRPLAPSAPLAPARASRPLSTASSSASSSAPKSPPRREGAADNAVEAISSDLAKLLDSELATSLKLTWPFGTVFLEKYGYDLVEADEEIELIRTVKKHQVSVKFSAGADAVDQEEMNQRLAQEAAAAGENEKQIKEVAENIANDKSVPFIIGIHKLDENATRKGSLHIFCEAEPTEHSIEVTGLGGDEQAAWGIGFEPLSQPVKDRIIDYLIEFGIGPDLAQFVCEYKANMKGTNVPGLRRLKQFFDEKN